MKAQGLLVMGVSGSGKTTVGRLLAERLGWSFFDADDFHPRANKAKMEAGIPLDDADRTPWLAALRSLLSGELKAGRHPILACSALKGQYRRTLLDGNAGVRIVYLKGSFDLIHARMAGRAGHYMRPGMLRSQFDALEEPSGALEADISRPPEEIVELILHALSSGKDTETEPPSLS